MVYGPDDKVAPITIHDRPRREWTPQIPGIIAERP